MLRQLCLALLLFIFAISPSYATDCSAIFPGPTTFAVNGGISINNSSTCDGGTCSPVNSFPTPTIPFYSASGFFNATNITDGVYQHLYWGHSQGATITFSGTGTAVIFINGSATIQQNTRINAGGSPANVLLIVAGSLTINRFAEINAHIYAGGSISVNRNAYITGSISANGAMQVDQQGAFFYSSGDADKLDGHGFCEGSAASINHYQILHSANGLTCEAESVTVKACTNSFDGTCIETTENVSLDVIAQGNSHSVIKAINFTGNTTFDLSYRVAETATLSIDNASVAASNGYVCNSNNPNDCDITFSNAGFKITGFNDIEVAGEPMQSGGNSRIFIQAVKDDDGVCQGYFDSAGTRRIDFALKAANPALTSGLDYKIANNTVPKYLGAPSSYSAIDLAFDNDSTAQLPINTYHDAGEVLLYAKHDIAATPDNPAVTLFGNSEIFYVRPYEFIVSANTDSNNDGTSPLMSADINATITEQAGAEFNLNILAVNKDGDITPNFTQQVELALQRILPTSDGVTGTLTGDNLNLTTTLPGDNLTYATSAFSFNSGQYQSLKTATGAVYNEVGSVKLYVREQQTVSNSNNHASGLATIGRFIPAKFVLTQSSVTNFCTVAGEPMSYMSQPEIKLVYEITAQNQAGDTTKNYFATLAKATIDVVAENAAVDDVTHRLRDFSGVDWYDGVYKNEDDGGSGGLEFDKGQFVRESSPDGPFEQVRFGVKLTDVEGSELEGLDMLQNTARSLAGFDSKIRFGRWVIENAYGPETEVLPVVMRLEYFDGSGFSGFVVNDGDSCTTPNLEPVLNDARITSGAIWSGGLNSGQYRLIDKDTSDNLEVDDVEADTDGTFISGHFIELPNRFTFSAPGNGKQGGLQFEYEVPAWLKYDWQDNNLYDDNPVGLLNFGLFRGNDRIISWREIQN
ncbi:DUF6701 domain-containing protein [Thalassotalea sediminis]|uniref:DUF6701 domain-containing protein n=1 Tax=Thalassotalea sediminis TaxID=1759089 RepID=UPI0025740A27|nr:DUF6701 domain-containing protein [Thalassotalea sediminis]